MASLTYSTADNINNTDWPSVDGTGATYDSYFITGYKVHGQGIKKFQSNYLIIFSRVEEGAGGFIRYAWDTATNTAGHRYSQEETLYLARTNASVTSRRVWLRGQGLILQIKVRSDGTKPFTIVGYSSFETGNASV
jgi:hypothetical protein